MWLPHRDLVVIIPISQASADGPELVTMIPMSVDALTVADDVIPVYDVVLVVNIKVKSGSDSTELIFRVSGKKKSKLMKQQITHFGTFPNPTSLFTRP